MIALVGGGIAAVGAIIAAVITVYLLVERRKVGWEVENVRKYERGLEGEVRLRVKKSAIGELEPGAKRDSYKAVEAAYDFSLFLLNTGNRHITDIVVASIELDSNAKIATLLVRQEGPLERRWVATEINPTERHKGLVKVAFLRRGERVPIVVESVENASDHCKVDVDLPRDVTGWNMNKRARSLEHLFLGAGLLVAVGGLALFLVGELLGVDGGPQEDDETLPSLYNVATAILLVAGFAIAQGSRWLARVVNRVVG